MEALIKELRRLNKATLLSSVLFLFMTVAFSVSAWFNYATMAKVTALRSETRVLHEEVRAVEQQFLTQREMMTIRESLLNEQVKKLGEKLDALRKGGK
jgi:hypothetical protein